MTYLKLKFLIRWVLPALVSALGFTLVFLRNLIRSLAIDRTGWEEILLALLITFLAGGFCGLSYSIYRPQLRRFGRITGDVLTGIIGMNFYFFAIYQFIQYIEYDQGLANYWYYMVLMMTVIGGFGGWYMNLTKMEDDLLTFLRELVNE